MGKSNRIKTEKANNTLSAPVKRRNTSKGMPTWLGTAIVLAVLAALLTLHMYMPGADSFSVVLVIGSLPGFTGEFIQNSLLSKRIQGAEYSSLSGIDLSVHILRRIASFGMFHKKPQDLIPLACLIL